MNIISTCIPKRHRALKAKAELQFNNAVVEHCACDDSDDGTLLKYSGFYFLNKTLGQLI